MDRVLDRLFLGDTADLSGTAPLAALGFSGVLDLRDCGPTPELGVRTQRLANRDGDPWSERQVEDALAFVAERLRYGRVLVACAAGMSRSVSIVIGHLVRSGWGPAEAFRHVKAARPQASPVPSMLLSVLKVATKEEGP